MNNTNITQDNKDMSYNISKAPSLFEDWINAIYYDEDFDEDWYNDTSSLVIRNVFSFFRL